MPRAISIGSALVALVFLVLVLADATLIDRRPPSVTEVRLSATAGDSRIADPIASINVVFSESLRKPTAESRFHLEPAVAGALTWDGATLIFTPSEPLPAATDFIVRIDAGFVDLAGNVATVGVDEWAFATSRPPRILAVNPLDGAVGLPIDAVVELDFDRLMDTASVEAAIVLEPAVAFEATWSGAHVALSFPAGLQIGTPYTLRITVDAEDTAGGHLAIPFQTSFTTVSAGMAGQPVPADGIAGVSVRSPIAVFFPAAIDPATIESAISVSPAVSGNASVIAVPAGGPARVLVFEPSSALAESTTYTVTLAPVVRAIGEDGDLAPGLTWSFTTGAATESVQNQVTFLSGRTGAQNVWVVNPDGSNERQLTWELAGVRSFDVTGDGRRLVFDSAEGVGTVDVNGDNRQILTADQLVETSPRFTPDESAILLSRRDGALGTDLGWWLVPTPWTFGDPRQVLATGAVDSGEFTVPPAFDASGEHVLITTADGTQLQLVDLSRDPFVAVPIRSVSGVSGTPAWSAAAGAFALTGLGSSASTSVHLVDASGAVTALPGGRRVGPIAVDQAGRMLVLVDRADVERHLLLIDASGHEVSDLTGDPALVELGAAFSPDGRRVIAARQRVQRPPELWLIDLDGGETVQLTSDGSDPRWLP